ncbi:hypothetical protein PAST3_10813 [Cutibacterium acnes HL201PA1]|nr:hypothetical protein PAST3_10813 [Cutibacterium acnes HL201PA1]
MCERTIAYRPAFLRDVKRLKNKHYDTNKLKTAIQAVAERRTDWLLLYTINNDNTLTLVRTGTHDQLL